MTTDKILQEPQPLSSPKYKAALQASSSLRILFNLDAKKVPVLLFSHKDPINGRTPGKCQD